MFFFQVRMSLVLRFVAICDLLTVSPSYVKNLFTAQSWCQWTRICVL
jgi:hypothetical protein